ncbi:hypothetical protein [Longimicrobium sp.]|uniref:hypothetical protein n=1 Tax=Longimicrobium sp. TaxID=2029185 RepID=UPI003B3B66FB
MSTTGRYYVRDRQSGRLFCVEPINRRDQKLDDLNWTNGGIDTVRGGAVREEDSIITAKNGFRAITYLPPGTSPDGYIEMLVKGSPSATQG